MPQASKESPTRTPADTLAGSAGHAKAQPDLETLSAHYRSAYSGLCRQALGIVGSPEIAAEVVQDAYADTIEKLKEGYEIEHLRGWFRTVVRNGALQRLRERPTLPLPEDYVLRSPNSVTDIAHSKERCRDLYGAVEQLGQAQRSAFVLAELHGLNYREIASNLGRTEHAVRSLLTRARRQLRAAMDTEIPALVAPLAKLQAVVALWAGRGRAAGDQVSGKLTELHSSLASLTQRVAALLSQPAEALAVALLTFGVLGAQLVSPPAPAGLNGATSGPRTPVAGMPSAGGGAASPEAPPARGKRGGENAAPTAGTLPAPSANETAPKPGADDGKASPGSGEQPPASGQASSGPGEGASAPPSGGDYVFGDPPPAQDYNGPGFGDPGSEGAPPAQSILDPPPLFDAPEGSAPPPQPTRPHLAEPRSTGSEPAREAVAR